MRRTVAPLHQNLEDVTRGTDRGLFSQDSDVSLCSSGLGPQRRNLPRLVGSKGNRSEARGHHSGEASPVVAGRCVALASSCMPELDLLKTVRAVV